MSEVYEAYAPFGLFDGELKAETDLRWPLSDTALWRGEGLFETMLMTPKGCFGFEFHKQRMLHSLTTLGFLPLDACQARLKRLEAALPSLVAANSGWLNHHGEVSARLSMTRRHDSLRLQALTSSQYLRRQGLHLKLVPDQRGESLLTRHKSLSWGLSSLVLQGLSPGEEGLWVHADQTVHEGLTSTLFLRFARELLTPSLAFPILPGTTRARVLQLAPQLGLSVREEKVVLGDLYQADEVFMTSALLPVAPVLSVNGMPLSEPRDPQWCLVRASLLNSTPNGCVKENPQ